MAKKILIVDDDESILDAVCMVLEDEGYEVEITMKGDETVETVHRVKPDVILLDVLMSGKDGREICKKLKSDPLTKAIPVIMISAHPSAKEGAMSCGADMFLAKPFDTQELIDLVAEQCR